MINRVPYCAWAILTVAFLVCSIFPIVLGDSITQETIKKECLLKEGTLLYKNWLKSPLSMNISFYVFDLENPIEFLNGSKPILIQRGPFVYKEVRKKINVQIYENKTMSYQEPRTYIFDRERSVNDETFNFTTIDIVYMTLVNFLKTENIDPIERRIIGELLSTSEKPIMTRSIREYLWGYKDPLLHQLKSMFPQLVSDDQVAAFGSVAGSIDYDTFLIRNGVGVAADGVEPMDWVGTIERFNYSSNLSIWSDPYANMINGTDGTIWHPKTTKDEQIYAFFPDICRSIYLTYNETRSNGLGIHTYRYTLPRTIFDNSTKNQGFCINDTTINRTHELHCLPSGLFTQTPCQHLNDNNIPFPIIASNPHFLDADPIVLNAVEGMHPDDTIHRSFVDIEPKTGIIVNGSRRLQLNINVVNDSSISPISKVRPLIYPMFWTSETQTSGTIIEY